MIKIQNFTKVLFGLILFSSNILACSLAGDSDTNFLAANQNRAFGLLVISFVLFVLTIYLYLKKDKKGIFQIILSLAGIAVTFSSFGDSCGFAAIEQAKVSILVTFICFSLQFFTWFFRKKAISAELP